VLRVRLHVGPVPHNGSRAAVFTSGWLKSRVEQLPNFNAIDVAQLDRTYSTAGHLACELARVNEFVEDAKASGSVQKAIDRAGPRGVTVAPPGNPAAQ
jgi:hypothetical protein